MPLPSWPLGYTAVLYSARYQPILPVPFPPGRFPAILSPAYNAALGFCDLSVGPSIWSCGTSYSWSQPINPAYPDIPIEPSTLSPKFALSTYLLGVHSIPLPRSLIKVLKRKILSPVDVTCEWSWTGFYSIYHNSLGPASPTVSKPYFFSSLLFNKKGFFYSGFLLKIFLLIFPQSISIFIKLWTIWWILLFWKFFEFELNSRTIWNIDTQYRTSYDY